MHAITDNRLEYMLKRFWERESVAEPEEDGVLINLVMILNLMDYAM